MVPRHISIKEALEKGSDNLERAVNRLKERIEATDLKDATLKIHIPLTEIEKMCGQITNMIERLDRLEIRSKISGR